MSRSPRFRHLHRLLALAGGPSPAAEGINGLALREHPDLKTRRRLLAGLGAATGALATPAFAIPKTHPDLRVAIVGAGLAGLACAEQLARAGIRARIFEAADRVGGRCWSLPGLFPGQVAERGGEFIDTAHKAMLAYAREFGLALEDVNKNPGEVTYFFDGEHRAEAAVVEQFRVLVARMREDLRRIGEPTAASHTPDDVHFDYLNLREYLETRQAGPLAFKAIEQAYVAEYGLEIEEQSCLAFLQFIHADRRSKFTPFGPFSDERYHVIGGNEQIAHGLALRVQDQIEIHRRLTQLSREGSEYVLGFDGFTHRCDRVILTLPFSVLREVNLHDSLELPARKRHAIDQLRYGSNAKLMLGFDARPWVSLGGNGVAYSDLPNHQTSWETNPARASTTRAVITDYSGGLRGATLDPLDAQGAALAFLTDLESVFPGAYALASRDGGALRTHLEHWPSSPYVRGSYTANHPGYFTTIADEEAKPVGGLYFAGEHSSSFYEWQGFMEGAVLSGHRAAAEVLRDARWRKAG